MWPIGIGLVLFSWSQITVGYQAVTAEEIFRNRVVDRKLSWAGGYNVVFSADGEISGNFPNGKVSGRWEWRDGRFCRGISVGGIARADECLLIEVEQNRVRFRRSNGHYFLPYIIGEKEE